MRSEKVLVSGDLNGHVGSDMGVLERFMRVLGLGK